MHKLIFTPTYPILWRASSESRRRETLCTRRTRGVKLTAITKPANHSFACSQTLEKYLNFSIDAGKDKVSSKNALVVVLDRHELLIQYLFKSRATVSFRSWRQKRILELIILNEMKSLRGPQTFYRKGPLSWY